MAAVIPARDAKVVQVTLFADRAEVVREARVDLPAGENTVEFAGLPFDIDPDSFRAAARGVAVTLGAVTIRPEAGEPAESPEFIAARGQVLVLEARIDELAAQDKVAGELAAFLNAIRATAAQQESEKLGAGRGDPASIQGVYGLLEQRLGELSSARLARQVDRNRVQRELEVARAKMAAARPAGAIRSRRVGVDVHVPQPGGLTVRLTATVRGASWRPAYRASLDVATGEIALAVEASVRQMTGEDWRDVTLRLSTAAPTRGVAPPELPPILLRPMVMARSKVATEGYAELGVEEMLDSDGRAAAPPTLQAEEPFETVAETLESGVVRSGYNVSFEVPGRATIPADGADHRVVLRQETLASEVTYRAAAELVPAAYLVAKTKAPADYPLLAGPARVFAGGAYLGSFHLAETGPSEELTLPFGADNRIKIERLRLPESRERAGGKGRSEVEYGFRTLVENLRDQPIVIAVEDRMPVSEDERIVVEMGRQTTPGFARDERRPGVLIWTLTIPARGRSEVGLYYSIQQ